MSNTIASKYCKLVPSDQTAIDIFDGLWKSRFPQHLAIQAGEAPNFEDPRVAWVAERIGGFQAVRVVELGPFEGYHSWQLSELGASLVVAVEGSQVNFLKCLIAKEILGIRARFLHGDVIEFLNNSQDQFDLCWACGILYHQIAPLLLLKCIAKVSNRVFLWTHFFDQRIAESAAGYPHFDASQNTEKELDGYRCIHYYRSYRHVRDVPGYFSGGSEPFAYWLSKKDILGYLSVLNFSKVVIRGINWEHKAGPTISLLAQKA